MNPKSCAALQHLLSAGFPGAGHFLVHRPVRAAVFSSIFFYCFEGVLLSILIDDRIIANAVFQSGFTVGVFIWAFAHIDLFWIRRLQRFATEEVFVGGIKAFLRNDLDESEQLMRQMLLANPYDIEARMYLALIYAERGTLGAARRQLRRCRRFDEKGVLEWETQAELERLENLKAAS